MSRDRRSVVPFTYLGIALDGDGTKFSFGMIVVCLGGHCIDVDLHLYICLCVCEHVLNELMPL